VLADSVWVEGDVVGVCEGDSVGEFWRVLHPTGRMIVVVPNRAGLWAHKEGIPISKGQPYSVRQLRGLLEDSLFVPSVVSSVVDFVGDLDVELDIDFVVVGVGDFEGDCDAEAVGVVVGVFD